ncbi:MAG: hypothetical protein AAFQ58_11805 [Pseudomonadota bacterium]
MKNQIKFAIAAMTFATTTMMSTLSYAKIDGDACEFPGLDANVTHKGKIVVLTMPGSPETYPGEFPDTSLFEIAEYHVVGEANNLLDVKEGMARKHVDIADHRKRNGHNKTGLYGASQVSFTIAHFKGPSARVEICVAKKT